MKITGFGVRRIAKNELAGLVELYRHLHDSDDPLPGGAELAVVWGEFLADPKIHCLVAVEDSGRLVATCTLVVVPNLTRGARPYGLIENVVVRTDCQRRGIGKALMQHAVEVAWEANCYKVMLMTGAERESAHRFYESCGFVGGVKVGFEVRGE